MGDGSQWSAKGHGRGRGWRRAPEPGDWQCEMCANLNFAGKRMCNSIALLIPPVYIVASPALPW
eukprot:8669802-Pyramimonas_sp.AAC.1